MSSYRENGMVEKMSKCNHPIKKQKIWRIWTTHFHQENESELGDKNPLGGF